MTDGHAVMKFLETASMEELEKFYIGGADRLYKLSHQFTGMKEANLYEAANFSVDVATDIRKTMNIEDEICNCGKCDNCVAARSDEHYQRKQDGILTKGV